MTGCPSAKAGRPKNDELDAAIHRATLEVLAEAGYDALAIAQVARAAGTAITSIYRRYPTKEALVIATLRKELARLPDATPDRGSLRADLIAHVLAIVEQLPPQRARILAGLMLPMRSIPALALVVSEELTRRQASSWQALTRRAEERGELPSGHPATTLVGEVPTSVVFSRSLAVHAPLGADFAASLVDTVLLPALRALVGARREAPGPAY